MNGPTISVNGRPVTVAKAAPAVAGHGYNADVWDCACNAETKSCTCTSKLAVAAKTEERTVPTVAEAKSDLARLRKQLAARQTAPVAPRGDWRDDPVLRARYEKGRAEAAERVRKAKPGA